MLYKKIRYLTILLVFMLSSYNYAVSPFKLEKGDLIYRDLKDWAGLVNYHTGIYMEFDGVNVNDAANHQITDQGNDPNKPTIQINRPLKEFIDEAKYRNGRKLYDIISGTLLPRVNNY